MNVLGMIIAVIVVLLALQLRNLQTLIELGADKNHRGVPGAADERDQRDRHLPRAGVPDG